MKNERYLFKIVGEEKLSVSKKPPIYGIVPKEYRDRHFFKDGFYHSCNGKDLINSTDPFKDGSLIAKWLMDSKDDNSFTIPNVAPGTNFIDLNYNDSYKINIEKSGPFGTNAINLFQNFDYKDNSNHGLYSGNISNSLFKGGYSFSFFVKIEDFSNNAIVSTTQEIFRFGISASTDNPSNDNNRNPGLFINREGNLEFDIGTINDSSTSDSNKDGWIKTKNNFVLTNNVFDKWLHIGISIDPYCCRLYVNGECVIESITNKHKHSLSSGMIILGSNFYGSSVSYKLLEVYNRVLLKEEFNTLYNQKEPLFIKHDGVSNPVITYIEKNNKLLCVDVNDDGDVIKTTYKEKIGNPDKNYIYLDSDNNLADSFNNNPLAGKINRVLNYDSSIGVEVSAPYVYVPFITMSLEMDTDKFDYIIQLTNSVASLNLDGTSNGHGANINIDINGVSIVNNNHRCCGTTSTYQDAVTVSPRITSGFPKDIYSINGSIGRYNCSSSLSYKVTNGMVVNTVYDSSKPVRDVLSRNTNNSKKSTFIVYEIHKDNNKVY